MKNEIEFKFGNYAIIEQKRHGVPNEMFVHKVVGQLRSNTWVDAPVSVPATETLHGEMEDVCLCICCGIDETEVRRYRVKDMRRHSPVSLVADEKRWSTITLQAVNELIQSLESAGELSIKEQKYLDIMRWAVGVAGERDAALNAERVWEKTMMEACGEDGPASVASEIRALQVLRDTRIQALNSQVEQLAAENARYSMSAGHADQRMAESRAVRSALGFKPDADDVSPSDLVEAINQIVAELCVIRTAHPQPLGPAMDAAIDAFNAEEMPETGMLNSYFILCESIRIKTPATDRIVAGIKASAIPEGFKLVPEQMYLSDEDIQAICMQCGNGDKKGYGDYEDGILWVGELSNDGEMKYGLNIANANYPEEGSITVFEFDEPLREGADK